MNHLCFLTGSSHQVDDSTISPATDSCYSPQAATRTMRLQHYVDLLRLNLTTVVDRVKAIRKGLLADRAEVTLATFTSFSMFMCLMMTAEYAGHSFRESG